MRDGRPTEVAADPFQTLAIVSIDSDLGMDVETAEGCHRLERTRGERVDDSQGGLSGTLPEQVDAASGSAVAARQGGVLELERVGNLVHLRVE